jgi:hypothetical protein
MESPLYLNNFNSAQKLHINRRLGFILNNPDKNTHEEHFNFFNQLKNYLI